MSSQFGSFMASGKRTPSTDEVVVALKDLKIKYPSMDAVVLATTLRNRNPHWLLDNLNWVELQDKIDF